MPPVGKLGVRPLSQRAGIVLPKWRDYLTGGGDPFPPVSPLSTFDGTSGVKDLGMLGNDVWGDCVFAGYVHARMIQAWLAGTQPVGNYNDYSVWPTDDQNITAYLLYNGAPDPTNHNYQEQMQYDNGADPDEFLLWAMVNGWGPMSALEEDGGGFADIDDFGEELEGGISNFGVIWNAINVSPEAMAQFQAGQPFSSLATDFEGGHLFPVSYRDPEQGKGPTWSVEWPFTWGWWRVARELSRVILSPEVLKALKFFKAAPLLADIKALGGTVGIQKGQPAPSAANYVLGGKFWAFVRKIEAEVVTEAEKAASEAEKVAEEVIHDLEGRSDRTPVDGGPDVYELVPGAGTPRAVLPTDGQGRPLGVPFGDK